MPRRLDNAKQRQDTSGNINSQLWVLQVVGSNPAAPTKNSRSAAVFNSLLCGKVLGGLGQSERT